ncbi:MAG TPA: FAD-dependent oxidoreductase [bacterium]|nr:FAD-dependent oxidoreductase [bacterium]
MRSDFLKRLGLVVLSLLAGFPLLAVQEINVDVCVYGGASGGVVAAVQAARMGKSVALVALNNHLGGMSSSGLGWTDIGHVDNDSGDYIQGVAREFYNRIGKKYGLSGTKWTFEPHVAEAVFNDMVQEAGVTVYTNQLLASVTKQGSQIIAATMNNGNIFRAKMFIDASYEGDLMAKAGVTYTIGRESTNTYGESLNGIRPPNSDFTGYSIDPYLVPGNSASGLLPLIQSGSPGTPGNADQRVQAYNFRLCLTTTATNKLPITAPFGYNTNQFELLARYIQALSSPSLGTFLTVSPVPNGKTDINNNGALSTDFVGESAAYVEADDATRAQIWQAHRNYQQGLLYFLATDPRVPSNVRNSMLNYGFCKDEFADNGGWPYEIYVREGRRMISDYVMTQSNVFNQLVVPDAIGMAGYFTDSHYLQRVVVNGQVRNEGNARGDITVPYPISYRALVPKAAECSNLLVPWSLSASHTAFSSIRMEPVFMILGQASGTAACFAIDEQTNVQSINIPKLQAQLTADGQFLQMTGSTSTSSNNLRSLLLDFGPTMVSTFADQMNSPAHTVGGLSSLQTNWNTGLMADTASGLVYSDGTAATGISVEMGRSAAGSGVIDFNLNDFISNNPLGGAQNTGIYAGNSPVKDAFYGGSSGGGALAVGIRVNGLAAGTYTVYVAGRNTSTSGSDPEQFFCTNGASASTYIFTNSPSVYQLNSSPANISGFVAGDNCNLMVVTLGAGQSLYLASAGATTNNLRGFLNAVEILPGIQTNLPTVNLWATAATGSRQGLAPGSFTVSRNGNTTEPLTINWNISGTALNGADYQPLGFSVTLPAGMVATNIAVKPLAVSAPTGDKVATFSLTANAAYAVGSQTSASITIQDTPINNWRWQYFGINATNPAVAGDAACPTGDGVSNLMKYALGLNPTQAVTASLTAPILSTNGFFQLCYTRPDPPPTDIIYQVEVSDDLLTWCTTACAAIRQIIFKSSNSATVIWECYDTINTAQKKFMRLQVQRKDT